MNLRLLVRRSAVHILGIGLYRVKRFSASVKINSIAIAMR